MSGWDDGSIRKRSLFARMPCRMKEIFLDKKAAFEISFERASAFKLTVVPSMLSSRHDKNPLEDGSSLSAGGSSGGAGTTIPTQFDVADSKSRASESADGWESSIGGRVGTRV